MSVAELPHTRGCLVCGRDNPHGLRLQLHVDESTGLVTCRFTPRPEHIGFEGIVHGGVLATVLDEAMVWAATWSGKRFCVCGELTTRFQKVVEIGREVRVEAKVLTSRSRLIETVGTILGSDSEILVSAAGKYLPLPTDRSREFMGTLIDEPATARTAAALRGNAGS